MALPIGSALPSPSASPLKPGAAAAGIGASDAGFGDAIGKLVGDVESTETEANAAVTQMLDGTADPHEAMIALQRAEFSLQLAVQVRNKLVQAYQDIMRMPV